MITSCIPVALCLLVTLQLVIPTYQQDIESRRYRPPPDKCDRHGRCGSKEGYIEEAHHDDAFKPDKDRPTELSRDDWPVPPRPSGSRNDGLKRAINSGGSGGGYNPKPVDDTDDGLTPGGRPSGGGGGYRGGYNPKPVNRDEDLNPGGRPSGGGYGSGGGYNPKPVDDIDDSLKPGGRPSDGGGGYRGGYNPKPVDRDEILNPGGRPSGGGGNRSGRNPKPVIDREVDLKPGGGRPTGGGGGSGGYGGNGGYNPKPVVDTGDDLKPARPGNGGGYNPKPVVDRDDYDTDREDDKGDVGGRPGGGYNPKPGGNREGLPKPAEDDYEIKPSRHGGGYKTNDDRGTDKVDLGGYDQPKNDDYNDYKDDGKEDKSDGYDEDDKPISIEDRNCICVPYYQCKDGHIVTDGGGIIDARKRPNPAELPLDGKFNPPSCGPYHVCCNTPETSTVKPYEHRCGVRNPSGINSRILSPSNKGEADFGEWPWQAAVLKAEGKVNIFQCGGVLIDKYHVLTVAHCVFHLYQYNEYPLKVRLGEWDTQTTTEFLAHEDYRVSKIIIHPEFRNTSLWNDVAVLRLQDPVLFAPHIDTICLPKYDEVFSGQNCVVTGWGKDAYKGGTFSNVMKEVALEVIDNYKCEEMLRKTRLGRFFQLHEGFLCAGGEQGLDSCKGDGGGPLVCYRKDKSYALAGIVSWGIDCGQPDVPGVYVKIQKFLEWISKTTGVALQDYWPKN